MTAVCSSSTLTAAYHNVRTESAPKLRYADSPVVSGSRSVFEDFEFCTFIRSKTDYSIVRLGSRRNFLRNAHGSDVLESVASMISNVFLYWYDYYYYVLDTNFFRWTWLSFFLELVSLRLAIESNILYLNQLLSRKVGFMRGFGWV